mgnify:CR=1 FL=1
MPDYRQAEEKLRHSLELINNNPKAINLKGRLALMLMSGDEAWDGARKEITIKRFEN